MLYTEVHVSQSKEIATKMFWWLSDRRPFFIGDEYKIELGEVDAKHGTAKIIITNLKTNTSVEEEVDHE
jgi:hypothetical protein